MPALPSAATALRRRLAFLAVEDLSWRSVGLVLCFYSHSWSSCRPPCQRPLPVAPGEPSGSFSTLPSWPRLWLRCEPSGFVGKLPVIAPAPRPCSPAPDDSTSACPGPKRNPGTWSQRRSWSCRGDLVGIQRSAVDAMQLRRHRRAPWSGPDTGPVVETVDVSRRPDPVGARR